MDMSPREIEFQQKYSWAVDIIQRHFSRGIERICDAGFLGDRYAEFQRKDDPIYAELLRSMDDEPLAKTFVSYWTIAQTLATRTRFWLEAAIAEIIVLQAKLRTQASTEVYSHSMLSSDLLSRRRLVDAIKSSEFEHISDSSPWKVAIPRGVLQAIDVLVGEQERNDQPTRKHLKNSPRGQIEIAADCARDLSQLQSLSTSRDGPTDLTTLQCNLLVIERKPEGSIDVWAIRYVNPKSIAQHAARKQERVNLLRLYAFLRRSGITTDSDRVHVCVAELIPRGTGWESQDHYPDYFSQHTYWSNRRLWEFIGIPFEAVSFAIRAVAKTFQDQLKTGLRKLLPEQSATEDHP